MGDPDGKQSAPEAPLSFTYTSVAREIVCSRDAISSIGAVVDRLGARTAMVLCGPNILHHSDVVARVQEALGQRCVGLFSGVAQHSPVRVLEEAVAAAGRARPEALVSVGGGSTHDTTKGVATLLAEGGCIHDHEVRFEPPNKVITPSLTRAKLPIVAVPTTLGAAELFGGGGFADPALGRKILVTDPGTVPKTILVDGLALATTPAPILCATAMGQLRIAVETVYSRANNPIGDALALDAIRLLTANLPYCVERSVQRLLPAKIAALMASMTGIVGMGIATAITHSLGAICDVPHGCAAAIVLPHAMRFNLGASADCQALIAGAMSIGIAGMDAEAGGRAAADAVARLSLSLGLPVRLRDAGVSEIQFPAVAEATLKNQALATNPRPIADVQPILEILRAAW
jgi:alcohol dehydrogenase class IV